MADAAGVFRVLDAAVPDERREWVALWDRWPAREVFAHPSYVELDASADTTHVRAATYVSPDGIVLYPFLQRALPADVHCGTEQDDAASDITAPYGYGGPQCWAVGNRAQLADEFWAAFDAWAAREKIVSEFIRFSLFADTRLPYVSEMVEVQSNVVRDLELSMDQLWMMFEHKVRKNVKKAQRAGILVEHDEGERLESFLSIYQHTMDRRDAHERYYFPREYFERLHATLPGQFRYFHAIREGSVLSTELVLVSSENVYSFLGGTREDAFEHRPNDILKHAIMDWAVSQGKRHFVLGGGYAPDDGIFRYKLAFAPDGRRPFYVGRRILLPAAYARLVERRTLLRREHEDAPSSSGFFPAYRG